MLSEADIQENLRRLYLKLDDDVATHGFSAMGVFGGAQPFTYTIGLAHQGLPDMIIFGMNHETAHSLLWSAYKQLPEVPPFVGATLVEKVAVGYDCALADLAHTKVFETHMIQAAAYYERHGIEPVGALQLLWPDQQGKLPSVDEDCDPRYTIAQLGWIDE